MTSNIVQTLIDTRVEHPISDDEVFYWANRLTTLGDELEHTRDVSPSLLTEREAEVIVRYYATDQGRQEIAGTMGLSPNRIDRLRHAAEEDLIAAEATLRIVGDLRDAIRPTQDELYPDE